VGVDELVLDPTVADVREVDLLADAVLDGSKLPDPGG
jgi:hypothetical protein